jgi:hypothetical protein
MRLYLAVVLLVASCEVEEGGREGAKSSEPQSKSPLVNEKQSGNGSGSVLVLGETTVVEKEVSSRGEVIAEKARPAGKAFKDAVEEAERNRDNLPKLERR